MSLHEYKASQDIESRSYPFYGLIMAAIRQADTTNYEKLKYMFPSVEEEFRLRYNAPGGKLVDEK